MARFRWCNNMFLTALLATMALLHTPRDERLVMTTTEQWRAHRDAAVWSPGGIATLAATHWLDPTPRSFEGVPGDWHAEDGRAIGSIQSGFVNLAPGERWESGGLELRGFERDGAVALRVYDPSAPTARGTSQIERWSVDDRMRLVARLELTPRRDVPTLAVDGYQSTDDYEGLLHLALPDGDVALCVQLLDDSSLFAAFSDATSGNESYRFRFLRMPAPEPDGSVTVDFNRAYLPPCAFSDGYVCVFPPPTNRWDVPVRAGERLVR